jgi:oligopeptide/dipeptide ABC transporter ATP-binding protein
VPTLLEAREVTRSFGGGLLDRRQTVALRPFSLILEEGRASITAVVGESGSGKTTLARVLLGLLRPTAGRVAYRGQDLLQMSRGQRRTFRREVQAVFQDPYEVYNPFYRVDHVLTVPVAKFGLAASRAEARARIERALRAVGLRPDETLGRFPHELSGGQRQRVMVARALLLEPRVILADEPVSMVDASLRATILGALRQMTLDLRIPVVYITHDLATAYQIAENIVVLYRGAVVEAGDVELVVKAPRHPYTQLLVGSIPLPGVERTWGLEVSPVATSARLDGDAPGCLFEDRCPAAMPACRVAPPPLYRTDPHRVVACFLHGGTPVLPPSELATAFVRSHTAPGPAATTQ